MKKKEIVVADSREKNCFSGARVVMKYIFLSISVPIYLSIYLYPFAYSEFSAVAIYFIFA